MFAQYFVNIRIGFIMEVNHAGIIRVHHAMNQLNGHEYLRVCFGDVPGIRLPLFQLKLTGFDIVRNPRVVFKQFL